MLEGLRVYIDTRWVYVLFVSLQFLLQHGTALFYQRARDWLDRRHPDDLPLHAGDWLKERIREMGIDGLEVGVAPEKQKQVDAYVPSARLILLTPTTYTKHDASYWAVAAHELGHALVDRSSRTNALVTHGARGLLAWFAGLAWSILLGNMFYRLPLLNRVAFALLVASLLGDVVVMVGEARASVIARRILASDRRMSPPLLRTATATLVVAFATYLGAFAGRVILLGAWDAVITVIERHPPSAPAAPLGTSALVLVGLLSVVLLLMAVRGVLMAFRKRRLDLRMLGGHAVRGFLVAALLYLVWNQPLGPVFVACCIAASYSLRLAMVLVLLPILVPLVIVLLFAVGFTAGLVGRLRKRATARAPAVTAPPARPLRPDERAAAEKSYADAMARARPDRSLSTLAFNCVEALACVPAIVTFWLLR